MNTAADIISYAKSHNINMIAKIENGNLVLEGNLTDEFIESAKQHKPDLLLFTIVTKACERLTITPQQFIALLTEEDKQDILSGSTGVRTLRAYAESFSKGVQTGRIAYHPTTGLLIKHGVGGLSS